MDELTKKYKNEMKQVIVEQAEVNAWHQEDQRLQEFITHAKQIATACATTARFDLFQEANQQIIPDDKIGIGSLWCYFKNLAETHMFFSEYLLITRKALLGRLWNEFTTPDSKPYLKRDNLDTIRQNCTSECVLTNDIPELTKFQLQSSIQRDWYFGKMLPAENNTQEAEQATESNEELSQTTTADIFSTEINNKCIAKTTQLLTSIMENTFLVVEKHQIKTHDAEEEGCKN